MQTKTKFDLRAVLLSTIANFSPWLAAVLLITWFGYPGVVCVTPMAWLLAVRVGIVCSDRSRSETTSARLTEAALAGALLGLLLGILYMVIVPLMGPIQPDEQANNTKFTLIFLASGVLASTVISLFAAVGVENRKRKKASFKQVETNQEF